MRILISGGGLAGLTIAYWLHQHGHEPVVIERVPDLRRDGYGLDFFGTGYDVAERMGIIEALAQNQIFLNKEGGIAFVDEDGKPKAELKVDAVREVLDGKYMGLMHYHYHLEEVLYEAVKDTVEIRFGSSITAVTQSPESVTVTYENGESKSFDLLVGADGIHSNVRNLVFGPGKEFAYYLGYYLACYLVDRLVADSRNVALNHTAGLSLPQQCQMLLFSAYCLLDGEDHYKHAAQEIIQKRLHSMLDGMGLELPKDENRVGYYSELDFLIWAEKQYGTEFRDFLEANYEPTDTLFRLSEQMGIVLLNGSGFDGPEWSVRVSLANLNDTDYEQIGQGMMKVAAEYVSEWCAAQDSTD